MYSVTRTQRGNLRPLSGSFTLGLSGVTSDEAVTIPHDATADEMQFLLESYADGSVFGDVTVERALRDQFADDDDPDVMDVSTTSERRTAPARSSGPRSPSADARAQRDADARAFARRALPAP